MAEGPLIASTITMGLLLASIGVLLANRRTSTEVGPDQDDPGFWHAYGGWVWRIVFLALGLAAVGGTMLGLGGSGSLAVLGGIGAGLAVFVALIVYAAGKASGHPRSHAVGEAIIALGALTLIAVVANLLLNFGP